MNSMSSYVNNTVGHLNKEVSDSQKFQSAAGSLRLEIHPKNLTPSWEADGRELEGRWKPHPAKLRGSTM